MGCSSQTISFLPEQRVDSYNNSIHLFLIEKVIVVIFCVFRHSEKWLLYNIKEFYLKTIFKMCENHYNFAQPWNNNFYHHYLQQHAILSHHFQKLHSNIHHYGNQFFDPYNPTDICNHADCSSSCSSCSCCSSESCSETSSEYEEQEVDDEEEYDEEQYEDEDYDEDESECEYELNVDAILAMRAAKEELKKQEQADAKSDESSESKDDESVGSKDERDSKSDSIVLVDSDKDDFEFIDLSNTRIMDCNLYRRVGGFNKTEEEENKKLMMEYLYGSQSEKIVGLESHLSLNYEQECDDNQPSLWPVLPLRL